MLKNNKKRILYLIEILRKKTSSSKHLNINEIITLLEKKNIQVDNRKTLYDDFKILNECGYNIKYDHGYYLFDNPFKLSEIKIILDSINSLRNLSNHDLKQINEKIYQFISDDKQKLLSNLIYLGKHKNDQLCPKIEIILVAINSHKMVTVITKNNQSKDLFPIFIHRSNDYYYFYFHYLNSDKIYHYRFDNIKQIELKNTIDNINIQLRTIIKHIDESSNSYYTKETTKVEIKISHPNSYIIERLNDDFPGIIVNNDKATLFVSVNNIFFSKIVAYGKKITINDKDIAEIFNQYLKEIQENYLPEKQ